MSTTTTFQPIAGPDDPRVVAFLEAWHENGREPFNQRYPNYPLPYDESQRKWAEDRRKYICLNRGDSGCMMVEKATGLVYGIKGYGRIHRGHYCGHIEDVTRSYREATEHNRHVMYQHNQYTG